MSKRSAYQTEFEGMRPLVEQRARGRCEARLVGICQGQFQHVHHRKLRAQQGDNSLSNLLGTCFACHSAIHVMGSEAYEAGLLVHGWDDPATIPVTQPKRKQRDAS